MATVGSRPVVVDWDGTIADIVSAWLARWNREHPDRRIRLGQVRDYDLRRCVGDEAAEHFYRAIGDPRLYEESSPMPGALATLAGWVRDGVPFVLATATVDPGVLMAKRVWLRRHASDVATAVEIVPVLSGSKADLGGIALIDDNPAEWATWARVRAGFPVATPPWPYTQSAPPSVLRAPWPRLDRWARAIVSSSRG
ncbi:protein of unknown function [Candidatus Hydrogenisulfobacillus filiaventi]|uniref:Uncharacterized protein n=1 Tax=Candidatus Hydrogenisulfobacillus filiaventi TaxID=2707344 RepID=A0A6F8ZIW7_9FIRM|nr:protein of unknown function [Candidatus Hydrogenisulfobacillus filiaventi]